MSGRGVGAWPLVTLHGCCSVAPLLLEPLHGMAVVLAQD